MFNDVIIGCLIVLVAFLGYLHRENAKTIEKLIDSVEELHAEVEHLKVKQRVTDKRFMTMGEPKDKIEIVHTWKDEDVRYGEF